MLRLAHEALAALSKRYGFTPDRGRSSSKRFRSTTISRSATLGLPGMMGALGVCFGRVVTLDSPRARSRPATFNWSATLWHELAHVITLQMSNQRVPRWLTEGISVFEETARASGVGAREEFEFLNAMAKGELIKVAELNSGFIEPADDQPGVSPVVAARRAHRRAVSASRRCSKMLRAYGEGLDTEAALKPRAGHRSRWPADDRSISSSSGSSEGCSARSSRSRATSCRETPMPRPSKPMRSGMTRITPAQLRAGRVLFEKGDLDGAQAVLERAVTLVPQTMGDESARAGLAEIAVKKGDTARAIKELETLLRRVAHRARGGAASWPGWRARRSDEPARAEGDRANGRARSVRRRRSTPGWAGWR